MKCKLVFWLSAFIVSFSFLVGLIQNTSWSFVVTYAAGILCTMTATCCSICIQADKRGKQILDELKSKRK